MDDQNQVNQNVNSTPPVSPDVQTSPVTPVSNPPNPRWQGPTLPKIVVAVILFLLIAGSAAGFYAFKQQSLKPTAKPTPIVQKQTPTSTANPDLIGANWKTYTNSVYGFSIKYPLGYETSTAEKFTGRWEENIGIFNTNITTSNPNPGGGFPIPHIEIWVYKQDSSSLEDWFFKHITNQGAEENSPESILYWEYQNKKPSKLGNDEAIRFDAIRGEGGTYTIVLTSRNNYVFGVVLDKTNDTKDPKIKEYFEQILSTFQFTN